MVGQDRFMQIVEHLPYPLIVLNAEERVVYVNLQFVETFGYTDADFPVMGDWFDLVCIEEAERKEVFMFWQSESDESLRALCEARAFRAHCKDGVVRRLCFRVISLEDKFRVVIFEDLAPRQQIEAARRFSEARLQGFLDNATALIYVKDVFGHYVLVNRCFEELYGISSADIRGLTDYDIFPIPIADIIFTHDQAVLERKVPMEFEEKYPGADGIHIYISNKFVLHDADGSIYGVCSISTDITERKRAEMDLEKLFADMQSRTTQLQTAVEVSKSAITILDPEILMQQTVTLIQERFKFYYVGLFLVDEDEGFAVLRAGTGEAGKRMLFNGHRLAVGGESMVGWCVEHAAARIALDVGLEAVRFDNPLLPETRSEMALPLATRGSAIGALTVQSALESAFSDEDIAVLQSMADQLATAIENARLYEAAQREISERVVAEAEREWLLDNVKHRRTQLQTAVEVSKSAITILDPEVLMQQTVTLIQERFDFYYVGLFLVDEDGDFAVLRAGTGEAGRQLLANNHQLLVGGESMVGWCVEHAAARIALDVGLEAVRFDNPLLPDTRSEMALPLLTRGQAVGVLTVQSALESAFLDEDIAVLQSMADQLATAIENARLYEAAQREISRRKHIENEIRELNEELEQRVIERTAQLAATNKELEAFSYSVSHDLRAPLRSIDGFSLALLEDYAPQFDELGRDYLRRVRAASQRMAQLIDDLLKLSRLTRGGLYRVAFDLSSLAQEVVTELRGRHAERALQIEIEPQVRVDGDPRLLRVVLTNLFANAVKFTGKKPCACIAFGKTCIDDQTVYFIRDNGAGFDMAYADKLFGAFQRLHRDSEFEGTGIGLATVQRIIHRHGGDVWAEGVVGEGATFYFTL